MMDISSLLLRDFSDLTRPELIARAKHLDILRVRVAYVTNGAKVIHIRRLKSDPGVNLLS